MARPHFCFSSRLPFRRRKARLRSGGGIDGSRGARHRRQGPRGSGSQERRLRVVRERPAAVGRDLRVRAGNRPAGIAGGSCCRRPAPGDAPARRRAATCGGAASSTSPRAAAAKTASQSSTRSKTSSTKICGRACSSRSKARLSPRARATSTVSSMRCSTAAPDALTAAASSIPWRSIWPAISSTTERSTNCSPRPTQSSESRSKRSATAPRFTAACGCTNTST